MAPFLLVPVPVLLMMMVPVYLNAFVLRTIPHKSRIVNKECPTAAFSSRPAGDESSSLAVVVRTGALLSDLPTPSLLLELSLAEGVLGDSLDEILSLPQQQLEDNLLDGSLFIHTQVTDTSLRDAITEEEGSGKSHVICQVDAASPGEQRLPGGAYLGIGLANHHVGGYYWARGMGIGASLPAHGVAFRSPSSDGDAGELYWKKRGPGSNAMETTDESSNSNDGKRSEWADFLSVGDTVQLVPNNANEVLNPDSPFSTLLGVRRIGRPLGADPIVEKIWTRTETGWVAKQHD
jgi:hypothetical protein